MHHIWKKFAGAGAAAAAALALSLLAAPVSADTAAEIVTAPPVPHSRTIHSTAAGKPLTASAITTTRKPVKCRPAGWF